MYKRHLPVEGTYNIRDLGGYRTGTGTVTPWRRFLRADSPHRLNAQQTSELVAAGVRTVIDLRTAHEVESAPSPFAGREDVRFVNLPLFDDLAPTIMAGKDHPMGDPLLFFYLAALSQRQDAIRAVISIIATADDGAVMFNCTAGKDRTGLIAAILLGLAGVARDDILADYAMTSDLIPELVADLLAVAGQNGVDLTSYARMLESPAPTMEAALGHIDQTHGSVAAYLAAIGVPQSDLSALQERLKAGAVA
ncbi:MAG: tyrosine-protein phosphatase [Gemmobacter sp.]|nr:tyrosine-protein phosphatase [Gemmobacter sp.]